MKRPAEHDLGEEEEKTEKQICQYNREPTRITQSPNSDERSIYKRNDSRSTLILSSSNERIGSNGTQSKHQSLSGFNSVHSNEEFLPRSHQHLLDESTHNIKLGDPNQIPSAKSLPQSNKDGSSMKLSDQGSIHEQPHLINNESPERMNCETKTHSSHGFTSLQSDFRKKAIINSINCTTEMDTRKSNNNEPSSNSGKEKNRNISELEQKWNENKDDVIVRVKLLRHYLNSNNYREIINKFSGLDNLDEECSIMLAHAKVWNETDLESALETLEKAEGFYLESLKNNSDIDKKKRNLISNVYLAMIKAYNLRGDQEKANSAQERLNNILEKVQEQPPQGS